MCIDEYTGEGTIDPIEMVTRDEQSTTSTSGTVKKYNKQMERYGQLCTVYTVNVKQWVRQKHCSMGVAVKFTFVQ